jgi:hypothetical protein
MACLLRGSIAGVKAANIAGNRGSRGIASYNTSIIVYNGSIRDKLIRRRVAKSDLVNYITTGSDPVKGTTERGNNSGKS